MAEPARADGGLLPRQHVDPAGIFDTVGATVFTDYAFMQRSGDDRAAMPSRETGYHLYDKCVFINDPLPGGGTADKNAVYLADWYLGNLNAFMTAPIDYGRWLRLNHESPLASRLYEFFMVKFRRDIPYLQINYPYFVSFLPAKAHAYRADAMRQLEEPFRVAREHGVLADVEWTRSRDGQLQLKLWAGDAITQRDLPPNDAADENDFDRLTIFEGENDEFPESELVRRYHSLRFDRSNHRPTTAELGYAKELLTTYNPALLGRLLPKLADTVRSEFAAGKLFNAARPYLEETLAHQQRHEKRRVAEAVADADLREQLDRVERQKQERHAELAKSRAVWDQLDRTEQERCYDQAIENANSEFLRVRLSRRRDLKNPPKEVLARVGSQTRAPGNE